MSKHRRPKPSQPTPLLPIVFVVGGAVLLIIAAVFIFGPRSSGGTINPAVIDTQGAPKLSVDREKLDFGDVQLGQTVEASFKVTNTGDQPLRFSEAPYISVAEGC